MGYELELLENAAELKEILTALAPDLVVVDAEFLGDLESVGAVLRVTRERTGTKLPLLAISAEDNVPARLTARRAGADALLIAPKSAADVLQKLQELLESGREETYRVLIVEDDRSQGLFAESILRNAGMEARVIGNAFEVLDAMDQFHPDLVLMDLYMPDCDGTELTALIRERDEFLHTPIVFLSGESDIDKHYQALDAGGDDFLSKPIRPKHLISAVSNRVRRARAMLRRVSTRDPKDALTGLFTRSYTLERLNELLGSEDARSRPGGVLFFDLDGVAALRDKLGLSHVEGLLGEAGTMISEALDGVEFACRYGDGCFVAVCPERPDGSMESVATEVRNLLRSHSFSVAGRPVRLRVSVGVAPFRFGFADAGSLLNAAERCAREARASETGVLRFDPPKRGESEAQDSLTALVRQAIDRDGFELLYQPIVAVQGSEESQFQTLLRLRDDQGRLHTAAEIIPTAERADLMADVDRWVMNQALRMIELRRQAGNPVRLFVNQAATTLASAGHSDWIAHQLRVRNIPGTELTLELTLEDIDTYLDAIVEFCEALIPSGVHFCLSRFETGNRGDVVLEKLPVDFVKLSARYLSTLQTQGTRDALRGIVDRAHRRGLQVIAQRVEDAQSAATLWMSGVDYIQGNLVQQAGRELNFDFQSAVL
nr:EAL domain-containing protein [Pseudomarimonas arenosa]